MIRIILLGCSGLLLTILSMFALTTDRTRAEFIYVNPSGIHTLDPARMSWTQDFRVAINIWEGLTTWDPVTLKPIAGAAYFPPEISADGLTYTFTIKSNARWSNGDPVHAVDFLRGWRRGMEPGTATDYTFLFANHIAGVAEYVGWRRDAVEVLTALSQLSKGWDITAEQARVVVNDAGVQQAFQTSWPSTSIPTNNDVDLPAWLSALDAPWSAIHEELLMAHAAQMDEQFARIGVEVVDERTLRVRLIRPTAYFLDLTGFATFVPCHRSIERLRVKHLSTPLTAEGLVVYDPQWTKPNYHINDYPGLITNGPYHLTEWRFKRRARMTVNPYYHSAEAVTCRSVDMVVFDSIDASLMAYEAGQVDFLPSLDVSYDHELARLSRSGERPDFHQGVTLSTYFLQFNCLKREVEGRANPFVDARVRRAFSLAIDRRRIVEQVLGRGDKIAHSFVPAGAILGYEPPAGITFDPNRARIELAAAGYPGGEGLPAIKFLFTHTDERVCQAMAHMWEQELGVTIELRQQESKTFAEDKANHRFMISRGNWYADYNDPTTFLDCLASDNGNNDSGYSSVPYDQLLADARQLSDPVKRAKVLQSAERILVEQDLPIFPILHYATTIAIKPYVEGLYPNPRLFFPFRHVIVNR